MKLTDSTPDMDAAGDSSTALSPGARPEVLLGPEHEQRRRTVEAALFGGVAEAVSFGRYRLLHLLGQGGMGSVYAAYDDHLDRKIALKLIRASRLDDAELRARTVREARALARLSHPNVVHVYEVGEIEGQLFVAMEFLAGPTLRTWLDGQERPWRETLAVLRQAGEGLAAAHAQGVVHRDFKPKQSRLPPKASPSAKRRGSPQIGLLRGRRSAQEWSGVVRMAQSWPKTEARSCYAASGA